MIKSEVGKNDETQLLHGKARLHDWCAARQNNRARRPQNTPRVWSRDEKDKKMSHLCSNDFGLARTVKVKIITNISCHQCEYSTHYCTDI